MLDHSLQGASDIEKEAMLNTIEQTEVLQGVEQDLQKQLDELESKEKLKSVEVVVTFADGTTGGKIIHSRHLNTEIYDVVEAVVDERKDDRLEAYLLKKYPQGFVPFRDLGAEIGVDLTNNQLHNISRTYLNDDTSETAFGFIGLQIGDVVQLMAMYGDD